uniref:Uncharacterized protein n=1 Tax=Arundo donax TaxID=35708 RepID=A0A0A9DGT7_ARUDO
MGAPNVDYVPDTYSPPPPKYMSLCFCRDPGPSKPSIKVPDNVINIEDMDENHRVFGGGTMRTPKNLIIKISPALNNHSPEVKCLGERKFNQKILHMCNKSDDMYNEVCIVLKWVVAI